MVEAWLLPAALLALAIVVAMSLLTLAFVMRLRFVPTRGRVIDAQDIAPPVRALLAPGEAQLVELGFVEYGAMEIEAMAVQGRAQPQAVLLYRHPEVAAVAALVHMLLPDRTRHYTINFSSERADGMNLVTRNRQSTAGPSVQPDVTIQDCWLTTWRDVWQAHVMRMNAMAPDASSWRTVASVAQWVDEAVDHERRAFDIRVSRGDLADAGGGDGTCRIGTRRALVMVARALSTWRASQRPMRDDVAVPGAPTADDAARVMLRDDAPPSVQAKVDAYERDTALRRHASWSRRAKWLVFGATAALAAASFGLSFDFATLGALMLVLLVHEVGHFMAMKYFGYRDLKVFFVPFLGAAVTGRHEQPTARQELVVLFAGPLPGLVLGLAALAWLEPVAGAWGQWLFHLAVLSVLVNGSNLLPIHPLDGGKIFEILLLGRWPWLAFTGRMAGIVLLALFALSMDDGFGRTALLAAAGLILLGVAHQWREARVANGLRREAGGLAPSRRSALEALFGQIDRLGYAGRPWAEQRLMADALVPQLMRPTMKPVARVAGLMGYTVALLLPLIALFVQGVQGARKDVYDVEATSSDVESEAMRAARNRVTRRLHDEQGRKIESLRARVAAEPDPAQRWVLIEGEIGGLLWDPGDGEVAAARASQAASAATSAASSPPRANASPDHAVRPDLSKSEPTVVALLDDAATLAPTLPDAAAKVATVALWRYQRTRDAADQRAHLEAAWHAYDGPDAATADPAPFVRATAWWLTQPPFDAVDARLARIERCLTLAGTRTEFFELEVIHAHRTDHLIASGRTAEALTYARGLFDAALAEGDVARVHARSRLLVDANWAAHDAPTALGVLDDMLPQIEARLPQMRFVSAPLQRHGLWVAEATGRGDWQRRHAGALAASTKNALGELPWWTRLMVWVMTGGASSRPPETAFALEQAHWQGDFEEAQRIADTLHARRASTLVLPSDRFEDGQRVIGPRTRKAIADARQSLHRRYGLVHGGVAN